MKAKLIRPTLELDFDEDGRVVSCPLIVGKDVRVDARHYLDGEDDVIAACYWADRLLTPDRPKFVFLNHEERYVFRSVDDDCTLYEHQECSNFFMRRYGAIGWQLAAMWFPSAGRASYIKWESWDFTIEADSKYALTEEDGYGFIQTDREYLHVLTDLMAHDRISAYIEPKDVTAAIYLPKTDSRGNMVDYKEFWITDSSRPWDHQNTYWRVK